nr:hypothetical protein [Tanacetum cinerariifolium]
PKKLKIKGGLKRERNGSDSDSLSVDEEKVRRMFNKLKKKNKKEESDEQNVPKKGKKKENALTPEEVAHEAHLLNFPTLRARTFPSSLFSAIHEARVNMEKLPTVVKGKKPKADVKEKSTGVKDKVSSDIPQDKSKAKLPKPKQKSYSNYSSIIRSSGFKVVEEKS